MKQIPYGTHRLAGELQNLLDLLPKKHIARFGLAVPELQSGILTT